MKMTKLKVSGYFKTLPGTDKENASFNDVEIIIPHTDEEYFMRDAKRMFPVVRETHKELKKQRYEGLIKLYIDDFEETEGTPICVGKDIKQMNWAELQSMSCYLNIREIKLYKSGQLRSAQEHAYMMYQKEILGKRIFKSEIEIENFKEGERQKGQRLGLDDIDIQENIDKVMKNSYSMVTIPNDLKNSYNFAKVPSLILRFIEGDEPDAKETKK